MDKLKKVLGFLVFPLLLLMMLFPTVEAQAATDVTSKVQIDHLEITIASTGSKTEGIHGSNDTSMKLKYSGKFSFPNVAANEIKDGDYFIVKAPDNLSLTDGSLDLIDSTSNIKMGTVRVENANHQLVFTFNDKVKDKQNIRGDFVAEATETLQKEGKTVTYVLPNGDKQTITYKVNKYEQTDVIGETITKYGYNDNNKARAHFQMKINRAKKDMTGHVVKITDDVSKGAFANYVEGTFSLHEAEFETTNTNSSALKHLGDEYEITTDPEVYKANSDKKALLTFVNGKRGFELLMPTNMGTKSFFLTYDTSSPADTSTISNSAQYLIDNQPQLIWEKYGGSTGTRTEATFNLKSVKSVGATITADIAGKIKITKYDEADADVKLAGVVFEIREKTTNNLVDTVTTDKDGIALSKALNDGKYIVKEKTPKSGYQVNSQEFEVEMKDGKGVPLNISNKRVTVDFEATKTWVNGKATDYKEVKLGLYVHKEGQTVADAKPVTGNYTPEVTVSNGVYTYKWKNQLPERDVDGSKLVYSVRELQDQTNLPLKEGEKVAVGDNNYIVSYNADKTQVTNTYEVPKTNVTAKKVWVGGQEHIRPTVYFKLYRTPEGGAIEEVAGVEKKDVPKTDGTVEWTDLPATDEHGVKYTYSVMEVDEDGNLIVDTIDGYTPAQTAGLTVTNTYSTSPTKADIEVKKELTGGRPTPLQNEEFEFILKDKNGQEVQRAKNDAAGRVVFKDIPFDKAGEYEFTVVEVNAGQTINGVTYDGRKVPVTVHVVDDGKGKLVASVMYYPITAVALPAADFSSSAPGANLVPPLAGAVTRATDIGIQTFTNTYKPANVKAPVSATKSFINKNTDKPIQLQGGEFEFALFEKNGTAPIQTTTNDAAGNIKFEDLEFNKADTYHYTIVEKNAGTTDKGITYSNKTIEVTIKVVDNGKGALEATVTYDNNDSTFENTYKAKNAKEVLEVDKKLTNRNLEADMFEFTLTDEVGNVEKAKNGADGKVKFSELTFDEARTYTYTIKEVKAGTTENGITYDAKTVTATVTVTDDGQGQLHAKVEYSSDASDGSTSFTNVYTPAKTQVPVKKVWNDADNQDGKRPTSVTVKLLADGQDTGKTLELNKDNNWSGSFTDLDVNKAGKAIKYTIEEVSVAEYESKVTGDATTGFTITNSYTPGKTQVPVKKVWNDADNQDGKRPTSVTVKLLADGQDTGKTLELNKDNNWSGSFTDLDVNKAGKAIKYTIEEVSVAGYKSEVTGDATTGFTITNSYTPGKTQVPVKKVWNDADNQDGKRPTSVTVKLLADGQDTGKTLELNKDNNWSGSFTDLDVNKAGKAIKYTIEEVSVAEYESKVTGDATTGFTITNSYTPGKTQVPVKKVWNDSDNQDGKRPESITVKLLADGQDTGKTLELNKDNNWSGSFTDLDVNKAGKAIVYSVVEVTVTGYNSEVTGDPVSGFTITNNYTPETVNVKATKNWDDANNQDGKRPTKITINLLADGQKVDSKEIQAAPDGTWSVEFTKLAKYKNGKEIKYTVTEEAVAEYESTITDFTITNKYAPKEIDYKVTKVWNDANDQDGKRPKSVTVQLFKSVGGSKAVAVEGKKLTLTAKDKTDANTWVASFTKLPQFEAGKEITYSIKEVDVPAGYESSVTGQVVTNTHNPETVVLSGTKVWKDNNNQDGKRTTSVKVQIFKGEGEKAELAQEIEVSEKTGWKFESKPLPKYENGQEIKYTVKEVVVKEYTSTITTDKDGKYTITNEHTPEKIIVKGKKIWDDANNKDGIRPDSIVVKLLANGVETGKTATASVASGWTYEFTDLDRYQDGGKEIVYTVKEAYVPKGYTSEVIGTNIVNHHKPKDPEPNKPQDPEPNKPKDPEPGKPGQKPQLPNTGEKASNATVVAGLALMAVTGGLYFVSRKNK
ncbi:Cna B-type domain-containing protein [Streptococcus oralis]|uniref:Cna B-type domain-containing protein n=1 Tax=Streptococcus oralis TaxID=1303 RepID=UPI001F1B9C17|nr:Cna B-type domain-containing protein [Streptococcus oralis]UJD01942.1 Cna B-type domain-containing protein [Streptococcus oralis]